MEEYKFGLVCFICLVTVLAVFAFGFITGCYLTHDAIWKSLEKAGISRLIEHETRVDGKVTENQVEIVWKGGIKKRTGQ